MKMRLLALACAITMVLGLGMTAYAAPSVTTENLSTSTQLLNQETLNSFAATTTVSTTVSGATIAAVSEETAVAAIAQAKAVVNENVFIATVVDLNVPAGTGAATFTLNCPNVWAGQKVTVLHQKADGTWENIKPDSVANGAVTFTLTSYSPVAIAVDTTASKTADIASAVALLGFAGLCGTAVLGKKRK